MGLKVFDDEDVISLWAILGDSVYGVSSMSCYWSPCVRKVVECIPLRRPSDTFVRKVDDTIASGRRCLLMGSKSSQFLSLGAFRNRFF